MDREVGMSSARKIHSARERVEIHDSFSTRSRSSYVDLDLASVDLLVVPCRSIEEFPIHVDLHVR